MTYFLKVTWLITTTVIFEPPSKLILFPLHCTDNTGSATGLVTLGKSINLSEFQFPGYKIELKYKSILQGCFNTI